MQGNDSSDSCERVRALFFPEINFASIEKLYSKEVCQSRDPLERADGFAMAEPEIPEASIAT